MEGNVKMLKNLGAQDPASLYFIDCLSIVSNIFLCLVVFLLPFFVVNSLKKLKMIKKKKTKEEMRV